MSFCATIDRIIGTNRKKTLFDEFSFSIYDKAKDIHEADWNAANGQENFFLSKKYLHTLEVLHDSYILFRYVLVYKNDTPVFAAYFQVNDFKADDFGEILDEQMQEIKSHRAKMFEHYLGHQKNRVVMRLVTGGNNFVSGEHAFCYNKHISKQVAFRLLDEVSEVTGRALRLRGKVSATLIKDFYKKPGSRLPGMDEQFMPFVVEPNMRISLPDGLKSVNDYVALFSKKYRNRAKAIFKCSDGIEKRELSVKEVEKYNPQIYHLYEQVFDHAKFKMVKLSYDYFPEMKRKFEKEFVVYGYFKGNQMVAFSSAYILMDHVEAHFIGFDYKMNKDLECYQNLLYGFIDLAIHENKKTLQLGRTASEIKSTVGAKADELICYIKPQNTISRLVLKPFISYLQPSEWVPRNPFKEAETADLKAV